MDLEKKRLVCHENRCCGCYACKAVCSQGAISIQDNMAFFNAVVDMDKCIDCGRCHSVCPNNRTVKSYEPVEWNQGWAIDETVRMTSSSGGAAQAISRAFIKQGGIVWSCKLLNGEFAFASAVTEEEAKCFQGSKYVKSKTEGMYQAIHKQLGEGYKVLFIGLPCQSAGLQNFIGEKHKKNLYTIDLICHGTPSQKIFTDYLFQAFGIKMTEVENIQFRSSAGYELIQNYVPLLPPNVQDKYMTAFLRGYIYTENCYYCPYAKVERVSDITLGDSWGTELSVVEQEKGISLVLCQTKKGKELLNNSGLYLLPVNSEKAVSGNDQLQHPHVMPSQRRKIFNSIRKGQTFQNAMFFIDPKFWTRQNIKRALAKIRGLNFYSNEKRAGGGNK